MLCTKRNKGEIIKHASFLLDYGGSF